MPPTSSEIAATVPSSTVSVFCVSDTVSITEAMLRIWKSSTPWRASSRLCTAAWVSSIWPTSSTATVTLRRKRWPVMRRLAVLKGMNTMSSWSCPQGVAPLGVITPMTWKGMLFTRMNSPTASRPGNSALATVWPSTATVA